MARIRKSGSCADTPRARWADNTDGLEYLAEIRHLAAERATDLSALPLTVVTPFHDTRQANARFEDNLVHLLNPHLWNIEKLRERVPQRRKPRIDLLMDLNAKGNLSLRWCPLGCIGRSYAEDTDFMLWGGNLLNDRVQQGSRPSNEILFIRGVSGLAHEDRSFKWSTILEEYVLFAVRATVRRIERFTAHFLDVRMVNDFNFRLDEQGGLLSWEIGSVASFWAHSLPARFGLSLDDFLQGLKNCRIPKGDGDPEEISQYFGEEHGNTVLSPALAAALLGEYERYRSWPDFNTRI